MQPRKKKKKSCYVCGKMGYLKRICPKKTMEMSKKCIGMTEKPETATKINHKNLSWTTCSDDQYGIYRLFKNNVKWYPKKIVGKKAKNIMQILPNENNGYGGNGNQD